MFRILSPAIPIVRDLASGEGVYAKLSYSSDTALAHALDRLDVVQDHPANNIEATRSDPPLVHALRRAAAYYPASSFISSSASNELPPPIHPVKNDIPPNNPSAAGSALPPAPIPTAPVVDPIIKMLRAFDICGYGFLGQSTSVENVLSSLAINTTAIEQNPDSPYSRAALGFLRAAQILLRRAGHTELAGRFADHEKNCRPEQKIDSKSLAGTIPAIWTDDQNNLLLPVQAKKKELSLSGQEIAIYLPKIIIRQQEPGSLLVRDPESNQWLMISDPFLIPKVHAKIVEMTDALKFTDETELKSGNVGAASRNGRPDNIRTLQIGQDEIQTFHIALKQDNRGRWDVSTVNDAGQEILARWRKIDNHTQNNSTKFKFKKVALSPSVSLYQVPGRGFYFLINHETGEGKKCDENTVLSAISTFSAQQLIASAKSGVAQAVSSHKAGIEDGFDRLVEILTVKGMENSGVRGALHLVGDTPNWNLAAQAMVLGVVTTVEYSENTVALRTAHGNYIEVTLPVNTENNGESTPVTVAGASHVPTRGFGNDGYEYKWAAGAFEFGNGKKIIHFYSSTSTDYTFLLADENNKILSLPDLQHVKSLRDTLDKFQLSGASSAIVPDSVGSVVRVNGAYGALQTAADVKDGNPFIESTSGKYKMVSLENGFPDELAFDLIETDKRIFYYNIQKDTFILYDKQKQVAVNLTRTDLTTIYRTAFLGIEVRQDGVADAPARLPGDTSLLKPIAEFAEKRFFNFTNGALQVVIGLQKQDGKWQLPIDGQNQSCCTVKREKYFHLVNMATSILEEKKNQTTMAIDFDDRFLVIKIDDHTGVVISHSFVEFSSQNFKRAIIDKVIRLRSDNDVRQPDRSKGEKLPWFSTTANSGDTIKIILNKDANGNWGFATDRDRDEPGKVTIIAVKNPDREKAQSHPAFIKVAGIANGYDFYYNPGYALCFLLSTSNGDVLAVSVQEIKSILHAAAKAEAL